MKRRLRALLRRPPSIAEELTSAALRDRFRARGIEIGLYTYGCFSAERIGKRSTIGRYCSFADTARIYTRNHGVGFLGLTAYLYNPALGVVDEDKIEHVPIAIGDDVWLGHNAIVLPSASSIGRGAVVGAGAVVTKPVPAYAIVGGNPARVIRMRFEPDVIAAIEATRWWEKAPDDLRRMIAEDPTLMFAPAQALARGKTTS